MGIPGFNAWFKKENKGCYVPLNSVQIDHVYVDLNSILHNAMRKSKTWEKFHKRLHARMNAVLDATNPRKSIMIAVDGPAPLAKLVTQRERRKKTSSKSKTERQTSGKSGADDGGESGAAGTGEEEEDDEEEGADAASQHLLTGLAITPGTNFMIDITTSITSWAHTRLSAHRFSHLRIEVSDGTVAGEGEVKILGRLARHWAACDPNDTHVIVGDDADLVLMACVSSTDHLFVANTAMAAEGNISATMPVFSVDKLHEQWASKLLHASYTQLPTPLPDLLAGAKLDLTLLAVLASGNDYLPGLGGLKLEALWKHYGKHRRSAPGVSAGLCTIDPSTGTPLLDMAQLADLLRAFSGYRPPAAAAAAEVGSEDEDAAVVRGQPSAPHYLRGCVWLLTMYFKGECPDYRYTYDGPAPRTSSIIAACEDKAAAGSPLLGHSAYEPLPPACLQPLLPYASAMALLPASCAGLLPRAVRPLLTSPTSPLASLYLECETCEALAARNSAAHRAVVDAKTQYAAVAANLAGAELAEDPELAAELAPKVEAAEQKYNHARAVLNALDKERRTHTLTAHPYSPFPIDEVAAAAATVPLQGFTREEGVLTSFGSPVVLMRAGAAGDAPPTTVLTRPPPVPFKNHSGRFPPPVAVYGIREAGDGAASRLVREQGWVRGLAQTYVSDPDRPLPDQAPPATGARPQQATGHPGPQQQQQRWGQGQGQQRPASGRVSGDGETGAWVGGGGRGRGQYERQEGGRGWGGRAGGYGGRGRGPPQGERGGVGQGQGRWAQAGGGERSWRSGDGGSVPGPSAPPGAQERVGEGQQGREKRQAGAGRGAGAAGVQRGPPSPRGPAQQVQQQYTQQQYTQQYTQQQQQYEQYEPNQPLGVYQQPQQYAPQPQQYGQLQYGGTQDVHQQQYSQQYSSTHNAFEQYGNNYHPPMGFLEGVSPAAPPPPMPSSALLSAARRAPTAGGPPPPTVIVSGRYPGSGGRPPVITPSPHHSMGLGGAGGMMMHIAAPIPVQPPPRTTSPKFGMGPVTQGGGAPAVRSPYMRWP